MHTGYAFAAVSDYKTQPGLTKLELITTQIFSSIVQHNTGQLGNPKAVNAAWVSFSIDAAQEILKQTQAVESGSVTTEHTSRL